MNLPDLGSAKAKIARARDHMQALEQLADDFLAASPYELGRQVREGGRVHEYSFTKYTTPPDIFGLTVGDAVHNLRSALDHIAFALAQHGAKGAGVVMSETEERNIQFPVCDDCGAFKEALRRGRLPHVKQAYRDHIGQWQPYRTDPQHPERTVPGVLQRLDNTDKHRVLVTMSNVIHWHAYVLPPGVEKPKAEHLPADTWEVGVKVATFTFAEPQPDLDMEFAPRFKVAIEGVRPTTKAVLESCADWIERVLIDPIEAGLGETSR